MAHVKASSATIRNEMAELEKQGYLEQPHTSAGRVPTDLGYRYLVDELGSRDVSEEVDSKRRAVVADLLGRPRDVEELVVRTSTVLSQLTQLAALVIAPAIDASRCKRLELVHLGPGDVLLLVIADTGAVEKHLLELTTLVSEHDVERTRTALNEAVVGHRLRRLSEITLRVREDAPMELRQLLAAVASQLDRVEREVERQVVVGGQSSLASALDGPQLGSVLEVLEQRGTLARLLTANDTDDTFVTIGGEHEIEQLQSTSLVAQRYRTIASGSIGVLGPTRMDYAAVVAAVRSVAEHLEASLSDLQSR